MKPNWELKNCCNHDQVVFLVTVAVCTVVILAVSKHKIGYEHGLLICRFIAVAMPESERYGEQFYSDPLSLLPYFFMRQAMQLLVNLLAVISVHVPRFNISFYFPYLLIKGMYHLLCDNLDSSVVLSVVGIEGIQVHADEGGTTQTRGGIYWLILPAGYLGSSFWGMVLILASTNLLTARIAAGCFIAALLIVLFIAKNWTLRGLCIGFIIFLGVIWILQETTKVRILRYIILFIGVMNSLFSVYDIYDDLISRRVHSSDAEKFAEVCPCPCTGVGWGVIWKEDCNSSSMTAEKPCDSIHLALLLLQTNSEYCRVRSFGSLASFLIIFRVIYTRLK
ncbi:hypothetical protein HKD37_05G014411 [Glycine soja]